MTTTYCAALRGLAEVVNILEGMGAVVSTFYALHTNTSSLLLSRLTSAPGLVYGRVNTRKLGLLTRGPQRAIESLLAGSCAKGVP